jgi:raffinose/stachyose/melibiose transport system permease protein
MNYSSRHENQTALAFLAPALLLYTVLVVIPILESCAISLFRWDGYSISMDFIGLANFKELIRDYIFWKALYHNFVLVVLSLAIQIPIALVLAAILAGRVRGRSLWRTIYFAPMILPTAVIGIIWGYVYHPVDGLLNQGLQHIGLGMLCRGWLGNAGTALLAVVAVVCWRYTGFHMVLLMAGMETIPEELYEAARMDGASAWQRFVHVTLPLSRRFIRISAILSIVGSLKYFDLIYIMTEGGPPDHATELVSTYMFKQGILADRWGYGSALAVALFLIALAVSVSALRLSSRRDAQ